MVRKKDKRFFVKDGDGWRIQKENWRTLFVWDWYTFVIVFIVITSFYAIRNTASQCEDIIDTINSDPCYYCDQGSYIKTGMELDLGLEKGEDLLGGEITEPIIRSLNRTT